MGNTKKQIHLPEAERLFVVDGCTLEVISRDTGVSSRTLQKWKAKGQWETKRSEILKITTNTGVLATSIAAKILTRILKKLDNEEDVSPTEMQFAKEFFPSRNKVKTPEEITAEQNPAKPSEGVSQETILKFREMLGLKDE